MDMAAWAYLDEDGRLVLPPGIHEQLGLKPGTQVRLVCEINRAYLRRPVTQLAKVYVEVTNQCNLACRTCLRNTWEEAPGHMSEATFASIVEGLRGCSPRPLVFFGGLGEPLAHRGIVDMVSQVKALGCRVELITNATLLTERVARGLITAGLDMLWVSLDGARPESYADVRLGAALPDVLANVARFRAARRASHTPTPQIGIAFVAMKRNIADLPDLLNLAGHLGATRLLVTNVLPYTPEMNDEVLYSSALNNIAYLPSPWVPHIELPKLDLDPVTRGPLYQVLRQMWNVSLAGNNLGAANDYCPFVEAGAMAIGWDGNASPCLPLLHTHTSYLNRRPRHSRRYVIGNVVEQGLNQVWADADHLAFRQRVQAFDFAPCTFCGGCELSEANETDCFGTVFPACGGCLWAQGVIRCP